jgi:DNA-binding FrmR family transcriptional regulator
MVVSQVADKMMSNTGKRVNRIIGQLNGIKKMIDSGRDCNDIIQQVSAVKKAIDSLTEEVLVEDILPYIPPIRQKILKEMIHNSISL